MPASLSHQIPSPLGDIYITGTFEAIHTLYFTPLDEAANLPSGADSALFQKLEHELERYFNGTLEHFTIPTQSQGTAFQTRVWQALKAIPYGQSLSYSEVADSIGKAKATRAVASAIGNNPLSILVPCHRVIGKDGSLRGYAGGLERKQWLLQHEKS